MCGTVSIEEVLTNATTGIAGCCASTPSVARARLTVSTTASPIRRMGTSVGMAGGSLADLNYGRVAVRSWLRWSSTRLFDEVICPPEHRRWNGQAKRFRGLEVDDDLESCGLLDG